MEDFRFRAIDQPILPSSTPAHSSLQSLPLPLPAVESQNTVLIRNRDVQRDLEKQRIREEIMRDIIRRRVLEEEVRRELIIDQALAMHRMGGQGFTFNYPFTFQSLDHPTQLLIPGPTSFISPVPEEYPLKDETKPKEEEIIMLPKPERNQLGEKRTAETEPLPLSNKKVKEEEWFCQVCKVTTPSEIIFKDHIQGKKHRAKEGEKTNKLEEGVEKELATSEQKRFKFWCEICKIGTHSIIVMETHKKGKKHKKACLVTLGTASPSLLEAS